MANKVVQIQQIGTVTFSQNKRSRHIKISVKPDKTVLVSYPFFVSGKEVAAFVEKNAEWIKQQQNKFEKRKKHIEAGTSIRTKLHTIYFYESESNKVTEKNDEINVYMSDFNSDKAQNYFESILTQVYRYEAKKLLPQRLHQLAGEHGFSYSKVNIRDNRRNWGSCSSQNNISLNLQMMKLPDELIDYILLHELVHTKIKNHGPEFWEMLNSITNGKAKLLASMVKKHSTYTL